MSVEPATPREPLVGFVLVWCLGALPGAVSAARLDGWSTTTWAVLPWIAWSGVPRAARAEAAGALFELAACLPLAALGAWRDLAAGAPHATTISNALALLALGWLGALAARRAGPRASYAWAWVACVPLPPILIGALTLGGASGFGPAPAILEWVARLGPLGAAIDALPLAGESAALALAPWGGACGAALLLSVAFAPERRRSARSVS